MTKDQFAKLDPDVAADLLWELMSRHDQPGLIADRLAKLREEQAAVVIDRLMKDLEEVGGR